MMTPIFVAAAVIVIVGEFAASRSDRSGASAFARPKSSTLTVPSGFTLTLAGLRIAVDDPPLVRGFQRLGDLAGYRKRLFQRKRLPFTPLPRRGRGWPKAR